LELTDEAAEAIEFGAPVETTLLDGTLGAELTAPLVASTAAHGSSSAPTPHSRPA
jgi:hypothetical protein